MNKTIVETLQVEESESATEPNINWEPSSLYVETDYAYLSMNGKSANKHRCAGCRITAIPRR